MFRLARLIKDRLFDTGSAMTSASHRRSAVQIYVAKAELIFFFDHAFTCLEKGPWACGGHTGAEVGRVPLCGEFRFCISRFRANPGSSRHAMCNGSSKLSCEQFLSHPVGRVEHTKRSKRIEIYRDIAKANRN